MVQKNCYIAFNNVDYYDAGLCCDRLERYFRDYFNITIKEEKKKEIGNELFRKGCANVDIPLTYREATAFKRDFSDFSTQRGFDVLIQYYLTDVAPAPVSKPININPTEVTSDINKMKQYLKDLYMLEKEVYCSQEGKKQVVSTINSFGRTNAIEKPKVLGIGTNLLGIGFCGLMFMGGGVLLGFFLYSLTDIDFLPIVGAIIGVVITAIMGIDDIKKEKEEIASYEYAVRKDKERAEKEFELVPQYQEKENILNNNIATCKATLNQLYNLDIIFPKYRNFLAVSQIYEYFMSGRCTQLEGHEGAYNLFEHELRQNIIIAKLDEVLNQLEQIKQNPYMIYSAICEANSRLAQIESNTAAIAYNTSVIATNTEIANRYY